MALVLYRVLPTAQAQAQEEEEYAALTSSPIARSGFSEHDCMAWDGQFPITWIRYQRKLCELSATRCY
jgi:hypothetical protein